MARTLIGSLILRLKAEGLKEADKVVQTLKDVENTARRMGAAGVGSWGVGFQKQLNALKLSTKDIQDVERSWIRLHESIKSRGLDKAAGRLDVSHWKTNTLAVLAQQKADLDEHFRKVERSAKGHMMRMRDIMKAGIVATGVGYTLPYAAGMALRGSLTAASEQTRTKYRLDLANVDPEEIKKMEAEAARLSAKYGSIDEQDILELNRASYALMGGDGDKARALMEPIIRSFIADVTAVGVEKAGENLSSFLKAMDNLNVNEGADGGVDNIQAILEGWTKAKQVEGKDLDVGEILGFARRSKVAKYALNDDFLTNVLPALGQDMGFDALGDALSGAYQNLVTPSSGGTQGQYVKRQTAFGLRDKNNSLIERDLFAANPYRWTLEVLKPLLAKNGIDTANTAAVSEAVKKLMSNSKAAAALTGWIEAQEQIDKNVALYKGAKGMADVENARMKDPFAAAESFMAALRNFSAAILPMEAAAAGLNTLADGINALAAAAKDNPALTAMGIGGTTAATVMGAKALYDKLGNAFGLKTAATELTVAAKMLQQAAGAQGTGLPGDGTGGNPLKDMSFIEKWGRNGWLFAVYDAIAGMPDQITSLSDADRENLKEKDRLIQFSRPRGGNVATSDTSEFKDALGAESNGGIRDALMGEDAPPPREPSTIEQIFHDPSRRGDLDPNTRLRTEDVFPKKPRADFDSPPIPAERQKEPLPAAAAPSAVPRVEIAPSGTIDSMLAGMDRLKQEAENTGSQVKSSLEVQATPNINLGPLQQAVNLAQQFLSLIKQANAAVSASPATASNAGRQIRRNMPDYGVAP